MDHIFYHHNIQNFGGSAPKSNPLKIKHLIRDYEKARSLVRTKYGAHKGLVAGFTEVNNGNSALTNLKQIAPVIMHSSSPVITAISCGQTALAADEEFLGIAVKRRVPVNFGRVLFESQGRAGLKLIYDLAPKLNGDEFDNWEHPDFDQWRRKAPPEASPDYRGFVFAWMKIAKRRTIVCGFIHNRYKDGYTITTKGGKKKHISTTGSDIRSLVRSKIPQVITLLKKETRAELVVLGGDFNLAPQKLKDCIVYSKGPTTKFGNTLDYWYSSSDITAEPEVYPTPFLWEPKSSDHAIVSLAVKQ